MSRILNLIALTFISLLLMFLISCDESNNDDNGTGPVNGGESMTAEVSGTYEGTFTAGNVEYQSQAGTPTIIGLEGQRKPTTNIAISSSKLPVTEGILDIGSGEVTVTFTYYVNQTNFDVYTAAKGQVNITLNTEDRFEGTFHFTAKKGDDEIIVTDGEFEVER